MSATYFIMYMYVSLYLPINKQDRKRTDSPRENCKQSCLSSKTTKSFLLVATHSPDSSSILTVNMKIENISNLHTFYQPQRHVYKWIHIANQQAEVCQYHHTICCPTKIFCWLSTEQREWNSESLILRDKSLLGEDIGFLHMFKAARLIIEKLRKVKKKLVTVATSTAKMVFFNIQ